MTAVGSAARTLTALVALVVALVGVPVFLLVVGGPLLPDEMPSLADVRDALTGPDDGSLFLGILTVAGLLAWAMFALSVLTEMWALARHRPAPRIRIPGFTLTQAAAGALLGMMLAGVGATPTSTGSTSPTPPAMAALVAPAAPAEEPTTTTTPAPAVPGATREKTRPAAAGGPLYTVRDRDTLWDIAERYLADPLRYHEIVDLNRDRPQPDGDRLTSEAILRDGWVLQLPADAALPPAESTVTVQPGDTLSEIAAEHYGDPDDYGRIAEANIDRVQPDGDQLRDPDLIQPGWVLQLPEATPARTLDPGPAARPDEAAAPVPVPPEVLAVPAPVVTPEVPAPVPSSSPVRPSVPVVPDGGPAASHPAPSDQSGQLSMAAFAGAGALLAGVSLTALIAYRRRQFRWRRPGRSITETPPELTHVERSVLAAGGVGIGDATWLDEALRSLVQVLSQKPGGRLPDVVAVRMTHDVLELVLTGPHPDVPAPWTANDTATRWSLRRDTPLPFDPDRAAFHVAPYPTLASVGYTATGERWMVDLERVGALSITGDPQRCVNLARFLAAELAHNTWSEMLTVTLVGFGAELAQINPDRLTYTDNLTDAIAALGRHHDIVTAAAHHTGVDVLDGRLRNITADTWASRVLLIAPHLATDRTGLDELLTAMTEHHPRTAVALVLADHPDHGRHTRWQLTLDAAGTLQIPALDVELIAHQIPAEEAAALAQLLALAASVDDQPTPPARGTAPWDAYADTHGALRTDLTNPGEDRTAEEHGAVPVESDAGDVPAAGPPECAPWRNSVLPQPHPTYLEQTATTAADVGVLAPQVSTEVRDRVEDATTGLDLDLADWYDPTCPRPKITLLGPVAVRAQGELPSDKPRVAWNTEVMAYLATRPRGVTAEQYGTALWPGEPDIAGKTKVRQSVMIVRRWLGINPRTGRDHLPPATTHGGLGTYRVEDVLIDAELFRRLRIRGSARGPAGITDLRAALDLVIGIPFDQRRPGGYSWLADPPLDHDYTAMIVDVAHTVATHHLAAGEPELAADAAQVALRAGTSEDVPLLDLVAACDAQDNQAEARTYVRRILANHDAEVEEDLPPRTAEILLRRQWLPPTG